MQTSTNTRVNVKLSHEELQEAIIGLLAECLDNDIPAPTANTEIDIKINKSKDGTYECEASYETET